MKRAQRALNEKLKHEENLQKHLKEDAKVEDEIERITQSINVARLDNEQRAILTQKRLDLAAVKERAKNAQNSKQKDPLAFRNGDDQTSRNEPNKKSSQTPLSTSPIISTSGQQPKLREHIKIAVEHIKSPSKKDWQRQKEQENAHNPAIDKIMDMIGLEDVKAQVLRIKAKVETSVRQGTDLRKERLGLVLLGNPGTGKYTLLNLFR